MAKSVRITNMPRLGVNIDHIASLRELRKAQVPEPAWAALICQSAGADAIVAHLREDRRHIKDQDLLVLKKIVKVKFNLEMSLSDEIVDIACKIRPDQITLVPEKRQELTTEGGLDVIRHSKRITLAKKRLEKKDIEVSLFIDPDKAQIKEAKRIGIKFIELHTGSYSNATNKKNQDKEFKKLADSVAYARKLGLIIFAGHGLDYSNASRVAKIRGVEELNIGYSIICRAVFVGLEKAIKEMLELIK